MPQGGQINVMINKLSNESGSVTIQDEGCGIPQHQVERLGEPFFTTKEEGTGLGFVRLFIITAVPFWLRVN